MRTSEGSVDDLLIRPWLTATHQRVSIWFTNRFDTTLEKAEPIDT